MFKVHRTSSSDSTEANREGDDSGDPSAKNIIVLACRVICVFLGNPHFPVCMKF